MLSSPRQPSRRDLLGQSYAGFVSGVVHVVLLLALVGVLHRGHFTAPYKLPGTAQGVRLLTYYSPGNAHPSAGQLAIKDPPKVPPPPTAPGKIAAPKAAEVAAATEHGVGSAAESGLGSGDVKIALSKVFPHPMPDLSSMPHGTSGDVVLDAVIDDQGAIQKLTVVQSLGPAIDQAVIATVMKWSYTPATRNGVPVASEQELLFHYARS